MAQYDDFEIMPAAVRLSEIIDALEMQFDESSSFLDLETGAVETVSCDLLNEAEECDEGEEADVPEWQKQEWETARRIVSSDNFRKLPTKFDIHDWAIMEEFALSLEAGRVREDLLRALHGRGAFRHFQDTLLRRSIEKAWFAFRAEALKRIAVEWCEENQVAWK